MTAFTRILVPLDGSYLAEAVLAPTTYLAGCSESSLILFHALERQAPATIHGQPHLTSAKEAQTYLEAVAAPLRSSGVAVETHVHAVPETDVAHIIADHAVDLGADLVALCAHGFGGLRDLVLGSIAQQLIQVGVTPVLVVGRQQLVSPAPERSPLAWRSILLPLDGAPAHEGAAAAAVQVAHCTGAAITTVSVVPTSATLPPERAAVGVLLPTTTEAVLDLTEKQAVDYLEAVNARLAANGMTVHGLIERGEAAAGILKAGQDVSADLIVLATHAHSNWDAFWAGSVTPAVLSQATVPVLLVRVTDEDSIR